MNGQTHGSREDRIWSMSSVLSKEQRCVLQLYYVEELTQVEVAREIGLSQTMVCFLLKQAYTRIEIEAERRGRKPEWDLDPARI